MKTLAMLWHKHRWLLLGFTAAFVITVVFLVQFTLSVIYWSDHRDVEIEPWMPIGYIARSYQVDKNWLAAQTGLPRRGFRPRESVENIAGIAEISFEEMRARLLLAIEAKRAE